MVAFIITFKGGYIESIEPKVDVLMEELTTELQKQVTKLDSTAAALDQLDLTEANRIYAAIVGIRFTSERGELPQLTDEVYEIRTNGTVRIVHKQEEIDGDKLRIAFEELCETLKKEDGPHTKRSRAKLEAVNIAMIDWAHRESVLDDIKHAGVGRIA